ncbi:Predicted anti-sigma-YlaC factor YlaD, contains Zn-finger domain [Micromonospora nigra]|uniref:Predicted anti-sigma-YlaC factor YlaD, contains Zn-finger domain n=1 Tax=Micromonospora nigra TaxID=145857 RepID=A0A1C6S740_9ACTN|nr:zf-HC2 domain-containing protein [Micromonospora nigra]SCL25262.1 Predicted anti-sigma-YlaC factor YlaD, contains Zn-finger domain [Micromonospora nigra]
MGCEQWREILSAQLDGETSPHEQRVAATHLDVCGGCRRWLDEAARVTRRARTRLVADLPDLTGAILAAAPPPARRGRTQRTARRLSALAARLSPGSGSRREPAGGGRMVTGLRAALGLLGAVQLVLGLAQVGRGAVTGYGHATGQHLWHESAAWNVAVGAGFLFVALRRTSPSGLLPMLGAFVATLVLLSVNDLVASQVAVERLVSHGFLLVGYLITVLLARSGPRTGDPDGHGRPEQSRWRLRSDEVDEATPAPLRLLPPPTARVSRPPSRHAA